MDKELVESLLKLVESLLKFIEFVIAGVSFMQDQSWINLARLVIATYRFLKSLTEVFR